VEPLEECLDSHFLLIQLVFLAIDNDPNHVINNLTEPSPCQQGRSVPGYKEVASWDILC
jgi:hypothetical protein